MSVSVVAVGAQLSVTKIVLWQTNEMLKRNANASGLIFFQDDKDDMLHGIRIQTTITLFSVLIHNLGEEQAMLGQFRKRPVTPQTSR